MSATHPSVPVWAIIPAAGTGRRTGGPKQTFPYGDSTLCGTVVRTLIDAGVEDIVVVTRGALIHKLDLPDDPRIKLVLNEAESEMIDSIRMGLADLAARHAVPDGESTATGDTASSATSPRPARAAGVPGIADAGVLVVPADMPKLSAAACRLCIEAYSANPCRIIVATHAAERGHPILFPLAMRGLVDGLDGGLNELPRRNARRVHLVEVDDPGAAFDVDTLADYRDLKDGLHDD